VKTVLYVSRDSPKVGRKTGRGNESGPKLCGRRMMNKIKKQKTAD